MADYRETRHDYIFAPGESVDAKGRGLVNLLLANVSGLSNTGSVVWGSGRDNTLLTFPGCRKLGMCVTHADIVDFEPVYVKGTSTTGYYFTGTTITPAASDIGYRLIERRVGSLTLYSVYTICSDGGDGSFCGCFMDATYVDHFDGKSREGLVHANKADAMPGFYFYYDEDEEEANHTAYEMSIVDPFGTKFPNREQIVVAPVVVAHPSTSFFGYLESPTTLYKIYAGNQLMDVGLNVTITVNGVRLVQLVKGLFVRVN